MSFPLSLSRPDRILPQTLASVCYAALLVLENIGDEVPGIRKNLSAPQEHLSNIAHQLGLLGHVWRYPRKPWSDEQKNLEKMTKETLSEAKALQDISNLPIATAVRPRLQQLAKDIEHAAQKIHTLKDKVSTLLQPQSPLGTPDMFITGFFG